MYRIGWFSTGRDEAARELLSTVSQKTADGTIPAQIFYVFSNREPGESEESDKFFELVDELGIELICLSSKSFKPGMRREGRTNPEVLSAWRREFDKAVMQLLGGREADLIMLAGYMLILSEEMCQKYNIINLHPALPRGPIGTWQEVIWQLINQEAQETGVMIHRVTKDVDRGDPITYVSFPIVGGRFDSLWEDWRRKRRGKSFLEIVREEGENEPLFAAIRSEGVKRELPLIVYTLQAFATGRIRIHHGRVHFDEEVLTKGYCLNEQVEKALGG